MHVVANDTLVENPLVIDHIGTVHAEMSRAARAFSLPVSVVMTRPSEDETFWINLIGRGYPSPNRSFRWCTDRMKIQPTSNYIRTEVTKAGQTILLLGVRRDESATRARNVARYDNGRRLNRHNDLPGCLVFRPIVDVTTDEIWEFVGSHPPPWGGSHQKLIALYRNSNGGECPVVTQKSDAPSCGRTSSRFGCWTCTVVEKDRSLEGFVGAGFTEFSPLLDFREWLVAIRNDPSRRMARRRDGRVTITAAGTFVPGPFTFETRAEILERILAVQDRIGKPLIADHEIERIREIWAMDAIFGAQRIAAEHAAANG